MNQIQIQKEAYYKKVGVAPGVPTEKGAYSNLRATGNSWTFNILENREKMKQIIILITINTGQALYLKLNMEEEIIFTIAISILSGLKVVSSYIKL